MKAGAKRADAKSGLRLRDPTLVGHGRSFLFVPTRLAITGFACLLATAALALAVAHQSSPYGFEDPALDWLGRGSAVQTWADLPKFLTTPAVFAALVVALVVGWLKQATWRVLLYAVPVITALLISEYVAKPLVQRTYYAELTFPSGSVTLVSATALAMCFALGPRLGRRARNALRVIGVAWVLLISIAVIGAHWHTPLDAVGSILLSVGIVTAGAAIFESTGTPGLPTGVRRARMGDRADK